MYNSPKINGPINCARLVDKNGLKTIYLFMDYHATLDKQTDCDNLFSKDINNYLLDSFIKLNSDGIKFDFFFEFRPSNIIKNVKNRGIYIIEIFKLFIKLFDFDFNENRVLGSKMLPNIRLHYIDIRDYAFMDTENFVNYIQKTKMNDDNLMNIFVKKMELVYLIFEKAISGSLKTNNAKVITNKVVGDKQKSFVFMHIINKIVNRYNDPNIMNKIRMIINKYVMDPLKKLIDICNSKTNFDDLNYIKNAHQNIFAKIMDIYFLRRFLDKKYINNGCNYSGLKHNAFNLYILVKYFNYTVTHIYYSSVTLISLDDIIKNAQSDESIIKYIYPPSITQCIDMKDFPANLL